MRPCSRAGFRASKDNIIDIIIDRYMAVREWKKFEKLFEGSEALRSVT
jgi:hypothetical protein